MNIYAKSGTTVVYSDAISGYDYDQETARKHLVFGQEYTVDYTDVRSCHTNVYLQEVPGVSFNSVIFD